MALGRGGRASDTHERFRVLCVDDEPNVLEGLRLHLERTYDFHTAGSGPQALAMLERNGPFAVVVSDMRMPEMDGAAFLGQVRQHFGDTVRILLTGHADLRSAIAAVNDGQTFRFLTKPCPPSQILATIQAATDQYGLITAERVLLDQTLHGSIRALTDVLALTHPLAFGRALRIHKVISEFADHLGMKERWQVEVAAMLAQIGCITLPQATIEKLHFGHDLSPEESEQVNQASRTAARLLGDIPRLEAVRAILGGSTGERRKSVDQIVHRGAQMLRIASDADTLEARGLSPRMIVDIMRDRGDRYEKELLDAFAEMRGGASSTRLIREVPLLAIKAGMILVEDLYMQNGTLLASRGYEVTERFVERAQSWRRGAVREPIRVKVEA
jgi:response regulator RpfG family c-di-GMP phosphodiesterase